MARESLISKWNSPSGLLRLQRLAMHGLNQSEICEQIGVPARTFRRWCTQDPRIAQATEPYPGRWTHHLLVSTPEDLDGQLLAWLQEAYAFAQSKR